MRKNFSSRGQVTECRILHVSSQAYHHYPCLVTEHTFDKV